MPNQNELLSIKVFNKEKYISAEKNKEQSGEEPEEKSLEFFVYLPLNPISVSFSTPRVTNLVRTAGPKGFVILDWGTEMPTINVNGQTGRILPERILTEQGPKTTEQMMEELKKLSYLKLISLPLRETNNYSLGIIGNSDIKEITSGLVQELKTSKYSPQFENLRFLMLKALEYIYENFDANVQMMKLEWMGLEYWGIITEFNYSFDVSSLWNIKFSFVFKYLPEGGLEVIQQPALHALESE